VTVKFLSKRITLRRRRRGGGIKFGVLLVLREELFLVYDAILYILFGDTSVFESLLTNGSGFNQLQTLGFNILFYAWTSESTRLKLKFSSTS